MPAYRLFEHLAWRIIEDEAFVLDVERRRVHRFNPVGALIWQELDQGKSEAEIVETVMDLYDVDRQTVEKDVKNFIEKIIEAGLLVAEETQEEAT